MHRTSCPRHLQLLIALICAAFLLGSPRDAQARDIIHVVAPGQNLGMIARRYHTTPEAIREANGLGKTARIYPGQRLRVVEVEEHAKFRRHLEGKVEPEKKPEKKPEVEKKPEPKPLEKKPDKKDEPKPVEKKPEKKTEKKDEPDDDDTVDAAPKKDDKYARKPSKPGHVTLVRGNEKFRGQLSKNGKLVKSASEKVDRLLRSLGTGAEKPVDRRLLKLLVNVSDHFGGRTIVVVSGYRPYAAGQYTKNSRHNHAAAIDFSVVGVPNDVVRDYCQRFKNVGVGYYPNSLFVHLDVRKYKTNWTDYSRPGQAPMYKRRQPKRDVAVAKRDESSAAAETDRDDTTPPASDTRPAMPATTAPEAAAAAPAAATPPAVPAAPQP